MMRKFLFATAALIALAGPATAADMRLPVYKAAPIVAVWSWSGCYVRGGAAWERDEYWATTILLGTAYTARETRPGWTIGIGGEYAFTNVLSGFVEYNYYDFGTRQIAFTPQVVGLGPAFVDINETKSVVRAGLNLRFGYAAPGANR